LNTIDAGLPLAPEPATRRAPGPVAPMAAPAEAPVAVDTETPFLLVNPLSFRASRGLAEQALALARKHGAEVGVVQDSATLGPLVDRIVARGHRRLMILSGDGTVHAVVQCLANRVPGEPLPELLVLPGGRSNLTANDLVPGGRPLAMLERALQRAHLDDGDGKPNEQRFTLRVEQAGQPARHGFFAGAALVDSVIRYVHAQAGRDSPLSTARCLMQLGVAALRGRSGLSCPDLTIDAGSAGRLAGPTRVVLASTLAHRTGLFDPYAEPGEGLRLTAVSRAAPRFVAALPRLLTGRFAPWMNTGQGYLSGRADRIEVTGLAGYVLDGEEYLADPALPLVMSCGPRLSFLVP
jgi:hypothetical protein